MSAAVVGRRDRVAAARRRWPRWLAVLAMVAAYPAFVAGYVYWHTLTSGLPGPRHGPQDAYRHVLASAVVAYTTSPRVVDRVTAVMEFGDDAGSRMDRHNNRIGASIGAEARSFAELQPRSLAHVSAGRVNARDPQQVTWLPPRFWGGWPI